MRDYAILRGTMFLGSLFWIYGLFSSLVVTRIMGEVKILINELEG
jgi:hypothetical protein